MTEKLELVRGSGNVFRDFGDPDAELEQTRAILAAKIIGVLDQRGLSVRAAEKVTGVAASEFSRIRNVKLTRFTIDRMITILGKLGQEVELTVKARPRRKPSKSAPGLSRDTQQAAQTAGSATTPLREGARAQAARRRTPAKVAASSRQRSRLHLAAEKKDGR
jgi:predicted XRE-type DNA-binding protein